MTAVLIDQPTSALRTAAPHTSVQRRVLDSAALDAAICTIVAPMPQDLKHRVAKRAPQYGSPSVGGPAVADPIGPACPSADAVFLDTTTPAHLRSDLPCQVSDADLWFAETPAGLEDAKARCAPCPLRAECLDGALARREPWGVWGGEIFERGVVIGRKRPRGRPRKVAA